MTLDKNILTAVRQLDMSEPKMSRVQLKRCGAAWEYLLPLRTAGPQSTRLPSGCNRRLSVFIPSRKCVRLANDRANRELTPDKTRLQIMAPAAGIDNRARFYGQVRTACCIRCKHRPGGFRRSRQEAPGGAPQAIDGRACPALQIAPGNSGPVRSHFRSHTTSNTSVARSPSSESLHSSSSEPSQDPKRCKKMPAVKLMHQQSASNTKPESARRNSAYYG